jgi:hypothetical protein
MLIIGRTWKPRRISILLVPALRVRLGVLRWEEATLLLKGSFMPRLYSVVLFLLFLSTANPFAQQTAAKPKTPVAAPTTKGTQRTGDLDALLRSRVLRIGVPYSKTFYYTVKGVPYGTAYETGKANFGPPIRQESG